MIDKEMILTQLIDRIKASGDQYWISKINVLGDSHIHVAVMVEPYITKIMKGEKTIESRFSQNKIVPWGRVFPGDIIIIKRSGGSFESVFEAGEIISKELKSSREVEQIKNDFNDRLCIEDDWWEKKLKSRYVTLIPIIHLLRFDPFVIKFKNRQAWLELYQPKQADKELVSEKIIGIDGSSVLSKMVESPVICISGKIGSGKTTIGKMIANEIGGIHGSVSDFLKAELKKQGITTPTREQLQNFGENYIENGCVEFASQTVKYIGRKKELPFVIDGVRHVNFLNAIKMICWPAPVYEVVLQANDDTLQQHIAIRGAEVLDSTHRAEGNLEELLVAADIVINIDGKEKEEILKEIIMKFADATTLSDDNLPLSKIREFIDLFNKERKWKSFHNAKDLIVSINIEASELLEIFQWTDKKIEPSPKMMERIKEELADVLIYSIDLANACGIDMTQMIMNKLIKNAQKYPIK
ncbi:MazG-like family protein [Agathobacter rectalis]|jgi:NTP pyrophosphatase (non-canonical NTP hydrolase)/ASC-1-like (ASCH) protein|uniref:Uncharacterized protein n=1 Tax=Agathobacter rectalis TaxID=39491 RepID=A0A0M6WEZ8_9FIRM|nr:MazG-like family protein [Agathobacter rectalis]CRL34772.1 hypothetical protein T1815_09211 [Agathobacter rectalis]